MDVSKNRVSFTQLKAAAPMPDLIEVQTRSYNWFLKEGLSELFEEVSPIKDFIGRDLELYLEKYYLDEPKFDVYTSKAKNLSYEAPLRVVARLHNKRLDKDVEDRKSTRLNSSHSSI